MPRPVENPPNPWSATHVEWIGEPPPARLEVFEEDAKSVVTHNTSPDVGFAWSVNPYRGCSHGCAYCYARPTHQYLGFGAGTDFDRKIVVKINAPEVLRAELARPAWQGESIAFSGNTDCYQGLEGSYRLTRRCLEVCAEFRNPVVVITKGALIRRDLDVLARLAREARVRVYISIAFDDDDEARAIEPWAAAVSQRFLAMRALADAGVPVGVAVAPVIPGLNDGAIARVLERAHAAGADRAFLTLLRLPREVLPVFDERLERAFPARAPRVRSALLEMKNGRMNRSAFGERMVGTGVRWEAIEQLFALQCRRLGMNDGEHTVQAPTTFRRPTKQLGLFDPK